MTERSVFLAALDITDPAARSAYLDETCAADHTLRQRVEVLLAAHAGAASFMDRALVGFAFVALLAWAIFATARRRDWRPVSFGLSWFVITLLPASVIPLAEVKNEHRLFMPLMGVVLAAVCALRIVLARRNPERTTKRLRPARRRNGCP